MRSVGVVRPQRLPCWPDFACAAICTLKLEIKAICAGSTELAPLRRTDEALSHCGASGVGTTFKLCTCGRQRQAQAGQHLLRSGARLPPRVRRREGQQRLLHLSLPAARGLQTPIHLSVYLGCNNSYCAEGVQSTREVGTLEQLRLGPSAGLGLYSFNMQEFEILQGISELGIPGVCIMIHTLGQASGEP